MGPGGTALKPRHLNSLHQPPDQQHLNQQRTVDLLNDRYPEAIPAAAPAALLQFRRPKGVSREPPAY